MTSKNYGTVIPAMVTPFDEEGAVDLARAGELARQLVREGADAILVGGTTGESPTLSTEEKLQLMETVVDAVGNRVFVWAGTGSYATEASITLTQEAEKLGVDGIMLVTPYYNKPPQNALYEHFRLVAVATELPVMLYNVPGRTSCNLEPATVGRLAQIGNIVAIKEASGSLDQVSQVRLATPDDFQIYSGDDSLTLPLLAVGAAGIVSVAAHLVASELRQLVSAFQRGNIDEARRLHLELFPLMKALFLTTNPIPVKAALELVGFPVGGCRPPLANATPEQVDQLRKVLASYGLFEGRLHAAS